MAARGANFTIQNADLVMSIGARLDFSVTGYDQSQFARAARKIVVDIDAAEIAKLTKLEIDLPVVADAGSFLDAVLAELRRNPAQPSRAAWIERCRQWKDRYPVVTPDLQADSGFVNTYHFTDVLSDVEAQKDQSITELAVRRYNYFVALRLTRYAFAFLVLFVLFWLGLVVRHSY